MINIEPVFLFVGYMKAFWRDKLNNTCSYLHCAFYIYGSKLGAHYRSTLFADLNLEITYYMEYSKSQFFVKIDYYTRKAFCFSF